MLLLLKNLLFTVLVPGTVAVYLPLRIAVSATQSTARSWGILQLLALLPMAVGGAIYFWCLWDFAYHGRGTPAPIDAPKRLVVRGLYRYVRNPMYIGVLLVIIGWAGVYRSSQILFYGVAVSLLFHAFVIVIEEPLLRKTFGAAYLSYCEQVSRWLPKAQGKPLA